MRITTRGKPKSLKFSAAPGMKVLSCPLVITDEHPAASYGVPVILRNDAGHEGELTDYGFWASVHMPQQDATGETFEPLATGAGLGDAETPYSQAVEFVRQVEQFGVVVTGLLPACLPPGNTAVSVGGNNAF